LAEPEARAAGGDVVVVEDNDLPGRRRDRQDEDGHQAVESGFHKGLPFKTGAKEETEGSKAKSLALV
jgi:hypothetical protein